MRKYFLIFIILLCSLIGVVGYSISEGKAAISKPSSEWIVEGDETLLSNVVLSYSIFGGDQGNSWKFEDSLTNGLLTDYRHEQLDMESIFYANKRNNEEDVSVYTQEKLCYFEYDFQNAGKSEEEISFYGNFIDQVVENEEYRRNEWIEFEPVVFNQYVKEFTVFVLPRNSEEYTWHDDYLKFPIGDELIVTPEVMVEDDATRCYGDLVDFNYDYNLAAYNIGKNCYVVVSYEAKEGADDSYCFTEIYLVSEDGDHLFPEAKLVKHMDSAVNIIDMGIIDNHAFYSFKDENTISVCFIDEASFAVEEEFMITSDGDQVSSHYAKTSYKTGYSAVFHDMMHYEDGRLYLMTYADERKDNKSDNIMVLEVYEEGQTKPVAKAKIYNNLFALNLKNSYYMDKDYYLYDLSFRLE